MKAEWRVAQPDGAEVLIVNTVGQLVAFAGLILLIGYLVERALFRRHRLSPMDETVLALGLGLGLIPLVMFDLAYLGVPLSPRNLWFLFGPWALISVIFVGRRLRRAGWMSGAVRPALSPGEKVLITLMVGALAFVTLFALSKPFDVWDAVVTWGWKAHVLYHERTIYSSSFLDHEGMLTRVRPRPRYPLGLPLLECLAATIMGTWDESRLKFVNVLFVVLLVSSLYAACRPGASRKHALFCSALIVTVPFLSYQTVLRILLVGGKKSALLGGLADVPLACFFFLSAVSAYRWLLRPRLAWLVATALFGAAAGFTKNEGLAMSALLAGALIVFLLRQGQRRAWLSLFIFAGIWVVMLGPWLVFRQTLPPEPAMARFHWSAAEVMRTVHHLPGVALAFLREAGRFTAWGFVWVIWAILSWLRRRQILSSPLWFFYVLVLGGALLDLIVIAFAPVARWERAFVESGTLARLLFHFLPLVIFLIGRLIIADERADSI